MGKCRLGIRWGALTMALMATMSPHPAAAGVSDPLDPTLNAPPATQIGLSADRAHAAGRGQRRVRLHPAASAGTDQHLDPADRSETRAERDMVLAATWHLDPELLVSQPTDSDETTAARDELASLDARLPAVVATYEQARAAADGAAVRADVATTALFKASAAAASARARWEADRDLLVSSITEAYTTDSVGPLGMFVSVETEEDLTTAMMMLQEVSDSQSAAVQDAEASRHRLQAAALEVATANARAQEEVASAEEALGKATAARQRVLADLRSARTILEDSVLADQLAAIQALRREAAEAAEAAEKAAATVSGRVLAGPGDVSFPLPAGASFVDQDNWGATSSHWAQVHTGDDFSTACGTSVLAATAGTVLVRTDQTWSGQWLVLVSTGEGELTTWYAHMEALLVADGATVKAGQPIGVVGAAGNATGCHLHFEVHPFGGSIYEDNVDPREWLSAAGVEPS